MASGNMKDIKRRIKSVQSTMQITKAMELVASSKMRRAKERALAARPYFNTMYETITRLAAASLSACWRAVSLIGWPRCGSDPRPPASPRPEWW